VRIYPTASPVELKAMVYSLFGELAAARTEDVLAIDYINRHYAQRFNVRKLAKRCMMSETAYRNQFRALTGLSPVRYINRLKIEQACRMMRDGEMRLQEISDYLNFYSLPYFYKVFKEQMGCTPREYLRQT
ncbi:MAG: helix-turn-helix transcriptional regulator, partial [Clostridia bacterium]|nr:helix-turn-helix transcriptional regulator [Clostridia bacterium]